MTYESQAVRDARIDVAAVISAVVRRLPRIILVTALLLAITFVYLMFQPRLYESSASILVEPRSNVYSRSSAEQAPSLTGGEAGVVSSQIELIKSRDTLLMVIDKLDLRSVSEFNGAGAAGGFSPMAIISRLLGRSPTPVSVDETVLNTLYERLTVIQERDSRIISVLVRSTDPQLAANIANAVANAHVARRAQLSLADTAEASSWLNDEIAKLRISVSEAETAVANFKVDNDLFTGSNNTTLLEQQLSTIASQISSAQERKSTALSRAALIRGMIDRGQPIEGVADVRDSVVIQQLSEEKGRLQGEKAQRSATLLGNHPTIQALTAQIAELDNQIRLEGRRVADALDAEAQIEADVETSLQADLTRAKTSSSTATQDTVRLDALEREAKAQRDLLEGYLLRYSEATSRVDSNSALPDVRVVSLAAPAVAPSSPKTQLLLMAVGIVSLALQIGLIVFGELISGRAIVPAGEVVRPQDELDEPPFIPEEDEPVVAELDEIEPEAAPQPSRLSRFVSALTSRRATQAEVVADIEAAEPDLPLPELVDPELEPAFEPAFEPEPEPVAPIAAPIAPSRSALNLVRLPDLTSDLVLGRTHLVMLAAHTSNTDCEMLAEELVGDAIARGLSVALVDAGSARPGEELGLTDLSAGAASFGDVVHKSADNSFAEVPWGTGRGIARNSTKPLTLVEALGDIYEVVILMTGRVGMASTLPLFDGLDGRLLLVAGQADDLDAIAETRTFLVEAGFEQCEIAASPARVAA